MIVAALLCGSMTLGHTACVPLVLVERSTQGTTEHTEKTTTQPTPEPAPPVYEDGKGEEQDPAAQESLANDVQIREACEDLVRLKANGVSIENYQPEGTMTERARGVLAALQDMVEHVVYPHELGYQYYDVNKDGMGELLFFGADYNLLSVFGYGGTDASRWVCLASFYHDYTYVGLDSFGSIYAHKPADAKGSAWKQAILRLERDGELSEVSYGYDSLKRGYYYDNGNGRESIQWQLCSQYMAQHNRVFANLDKVTQKAVSFCWSVVPGLPHKPADPSGVNGDILREYRNYLSQCKDLNGYFAQIDPDDDGFVELVIKHASGEVEILKWHPEIQYLSSYRFDRFTRVLDLNRDGTLMGEYVDERGDRVTETVKLQLGIDCEFISLARVINDGEAYYLGSDRVSEAAYLQFQKARDAMTEITYVEINECTVAEYLASPDPDATSGQLIYSVDLSTYEGIISAYRLLVLDAVGIEHVAFLCEDDDDRRTIEHLRESFSYQYYTYAYWNPDFSSIANAQNAFGYALRDFNGDGVDELVLMLDNYRVLKVFTQKDGAPVELISCTDYDELWLGSDGLFYAEGTKDGDVRYFSVLEMTADATLSSKLVLGFVWDYGKGGVHTSSKHFKVENGNEIKISFDEYYQYLMQYGGGMASNLYFSATDDVSSSRRAEELAKMDELLTFVPLFEAASPTNVDLNMETLWGGNAVQEYLLRVHSMTPNEIKLTIGRWEGDRELEILAGMREDGCYHFDTGAYKGRIELIAHGIWLYIDGEDRVYYFDHQGFAKG